MIAIFLKVLLSTVIVKFEKQHSLSKLKMSLDRLFECWISLAAHCLSLIFKIKFSKQSRAQNFWVKMKILNRESHELVLLILYIF